MVSSKTIAQKPSLIKKTGLPYSDRSNIMPVQIDVE